MDILTIVNQRGGVGKTETAHALGAGLMQRGRKVLFIDLDSQGNLSFEVGADTAPPSSLEVLTGRKRAEEAIKEGAGGDIITGGPSLAGADTAITGARKEYRLKEALAPLQRRYDAIVIDTPRALGLVTICALTASTYCIIPAAPEVYSSQGVGVLKQAVESVRHYTNPGLKIAGILITRFDSRLTISFDMAESIEKSAAQNDIHVFQRVIRENVAVKEAQAMRKDIFTYAPRSHAAEDYNAFIEELLLITGKRENHGK